MPYICLAQDLPDGTVNILDLFPNTSLRNLVYDPQGQTKYVNRVENDSFIVYDPVSFLNQFEVNGLSAYITDRVDPQGGTTWTPADLATVSAALIARQDAGLSMTAADINTELAAVIGGTSITGGGSTATVADILSILAGRRYTLLVGAATYSAGPTWEAPIVGSFTEGVLTFDPEFNASPNGTTIQRERKPIRHTYDSGSLQESALLGHLSRFANGVTLFNDSDLLPPIAGQQAQLNNARVVTVYNDDGTVVV